MLHCFKCGADLPDNLAYCLQCGARLEDDDVDTVVVKRPDVIPDDVQPIRPEPKTGSGVAKFIVGAIIGAGAVIVLLVAGIIFISMQSEPRKTNAANNSVASPTPSPTPLPSPKKPTPSPTASPANDNTLRSVQRRCEVTNPTVGFVNLRRYCDTRDCSQDASTLYSKAEPGDLVYTTGREPVTSGQFIWVEVTFYGETMWISSTRIDCDAF